MPEQAPWPALAALAGAGASPVERELDDARYYLGRDCLPCAERHLDAARRLGASQAQIEEVLALRST